MKNLYLVGGGGHCKSCIDVIETEKKFQIKGIFDLEENLGKFILNYPIIDVDKNLFKYISNENYFLITIGQIKNFEVRERVLQNLLNLKANLATVISPRAYVSSHSTIEEGSIVFHDALINPSTRVGKNCIINTKALIEHDCEIGNTVHISTGAIVNGGCKVSSHTFVGSQSVLEEGAVLEEGSLVPAGSFYKRKRS